MSEEKGLDVNLTIALGERDLVYMLQFCQWKRDWLYISLLSQGKWGLGVYFTALSRERGQDTQLTAESRKGGLNVYLTTIVLTNKILF